MSTDVIAMDAVITGPVGQGAPLQGNQLFSQFLAFGDSDIDSGYFFTHPISNNSTLESQYQSAVAVGGGIPTSVGGVMNSVQLAQDFGLTAIPVGLSGGTNYAASSATVTGTVNSNSLAPSIVSQIQTYLASTGGHADPNALYLLSGGGNDAKVAEGLSGTAAQEAYMVQQANAYAQAIEQLYAAGARHFIDTDLSGSGSLGATFTETLWSDLAAAGVSVIEGQVQKNVIAAVDANPSAYGITNTLQPPVGPYTTSSPYNSANGGADINPLPSMVNEGWARYASNMVSPTAGQTYLWADDEHLSAAGQQIEANYLFNLVQNAAPTVSEILTAGTNVVGGSASNQQTYQWQDLAAGQSTWTNIAGATNSTYTVQQSDIGDELRVVATYTDSSGATTVMSPATGTVVTSPVSNSGGILQSLTVAGEISLIYIGYFNRAGDPGGFTFWEGQNAHAQAPASSGGFGQGAAVSLTNIANSFTPQAETIAIYPFLSNSNPNYSSPTVQAGLNTFIENVYNNLFGHTADSGGLTYWTGQIESGAVGLGAAVLAIANGASGADAQVILNKVTVANYFEAHTGGLVNQPNNIVAEASVVLVGVNANHTTVTGALATIDGFH
jgi:phospholipase/lecithinase/hemolysin